jgi:hypothetical protein
MAAREGIQEGGFSGIGVTDYGNHGKFTPFS